MRILVMAAVVMVGCGGEEPTIDGGWSLQINDSCGMGLNFDRAQSSYAVQLVCQTGPNAWGSDVEIGDADFSVVGQVRAVPRQASCPMAEHTSDTSSYSFSGKRLVLVGPQGVMSLDRITGDVGASATIQFGCWSMGSFAPHPIQDL